DLDRTFQPGSLLEFLAQSDVVMNTLPLTPETRGLLGAREFAAMRKGSVLINTGRGATIRTDDLVTALAAGKPGAALLDVTDPEPLPADHPLWQMPNVVITPHYSGSHEMYAQRCEPIFLENLRRYLAGEPLTNVVDKEAGY
ncbi:MAG: D-2-hydroxyacid dehydrogenase, partial [Chloroflexi bacterium]|nr:D-2-hydroxyacid dehydrogenase [Chloroflexota bacterium]